jgi:Acetyltransferase (GNAT) domain
MLGTSDHPALLVRTRSGSSLRVQCHDRVGAISQDDWNALFPGDPEAWTFYLAGDRAPPPGFTLGAISVRHDGRLLAAAPLFRTVYRFDTSFQGRMRRIGDWLYQRLPALVSMRVMGLGSPLCDHCHVGFAAGLTEVQRDEALAALLDGLAAHAKREKAPLLAAKALTTPQVEALEKVFKQREFTRVTSLPVVMLNLPYRNEAHYFASLKPSTASYLKRKFRPMDKLRIEYRDTVDGLEAEINALYKATLAQSPVDYGDFGHVHPDYFKQILAAMGDKARLMLCWQGDDLLSFQLYVVGERDIVAKCIGMRYPQAKELNLYFINWLMMIRDALARDKGRICMGGTTFQTKLLFGGLIEKRWIYFRFRNPIHNAILPWLAPAFDFEKNDPELQALAAQQASTPAQAGGKAAAREQAAGSRRRA